MTQKYIDENSKPLISLESKCCLNAYKHVSLTIPCPDILDPEKEGDSCLNNANGESVSNEFTFLKNSDKFYKYSHRGCPDGLFNITDCGENSEISQFGICPSWLDWDSWSECAQEMIYNYLTLLIRGTVFI